MITKTHEDCQRCDRMAEEAWRTATAHDSLHWTSIDGDHVARWEAEW